MTITYYKSQLDSLGFDFSAACETYREALYANQGMIDTPAPTAHFMVEPAVRRVSYPVENERRDDYVIDFQVIDDTVT